MASIVVVLRNSFLCHRFIFNTMFYLYSFSLLLFQYHQKSTLLCILHNFGGPLWLASAGIEEAEAPAGKEKANPIFIPGQEWPENFHVKLTQFHQNQFYFIKTNTLYQNQYNFIKTIHFYHKQYFNLLFYLIFFFHLTFCSNLIFTFIVPNIYFLLLYHPILPFEQLVLPFNLPFCLPFCLPFNLPLFKFLFTFF